MCAAARCARDGVGFPLQRQPPKLLLAAQKDGMEQQMLQRSPREPQQLSTGRAGMGTPHLLALGVTPTPWGASLLFLSSFLLSLKEAHPGEKSMGKQQR